MTLAFDDVQSAGTEMQPVADVREQGVLRLSFEFFPPKLPAQENQLWPAIDRLRQFDPAFVSVTYGAGGSTRERTLAVVRAIARAGVPCAAHLTCVGAPHHVVDAVARSYWAAGVRHIVALRGDPVEAVNARYVPHPHGYAYANDLVVGLKRIADFEISVAGYPERHPESANFDIELDSLKRKVDAGASRVITQFCFENDVFERYVDRARRAGIRVPIVPGILPIVSFEQVAKFAARTLVRVPDWLRARFVGISAPAHVAAIAAATVQEQVLDLRARGFREFHFYTMNRAELTAAACQALGDPVPATARRGA
jgi:methylenetetrahydrofolate reductase (NADPH)